MNDSRLGQTDAEKNDFAKIASLVSSVGGEKESREPLAHAPNIPSAQDIAHMTMPEKRLVAQEYDTLEREIPTPVRDPFFASSILSQEQSAIVTQHIAPRTEQSPSSATTRDTTSDEEEIKTIRTYQSDVAEALKSQKTSVIQMVLSEQEKKREAIEEASPKKAKNLVLIVISVTLMVIGITAAGFAAWRYATNQEKAGQAERVLSIPSIIFTEEKKGIDITDLSKDRIIRIVSAETASAKLRLDFIEQIYFVKNIGGAIDTASGEPVQTLVRASEFFTDVESGIPESLARALAQNFFFGVHAFNGNQPFIILRTDYFESAFAGMLKWEHTMARDILPLFGKTLTPETISRPFEDIVIRNRDLRALRDPNGTVILLYIFYDKNTAIIATADETIKEVVDRLNRPDGVARPTVDK